MDILEERRNRADLLEVFKMYKVLSTIPFERVFSLSTAIQEAILPISEAPLSPGSKTIFLFRAYTVER